MQLKTAAGELNSKQGVKLSDKAWGWVLNQITYIYVAITWAAGDWEK